MASGSPLAAIMGSPKQASSDVFTGSRKHVITSPQTSPVRQAKRECTEADKAQPPATPTSLPKCRHLRFSPKDSPSRRQRTAETFTAATQSVAGAAAMAALRMPAPPAARPTLMSAAPVASPPLSAPACAPIVAKRPTLLRSHTPTSLPIIREAVSSSSGSSSNSEEVDELDDDEDTTAPYPSPLSPSFFAAELARLHPLLATCASPLAKAGVPDLATMRSLRRDELESFLAGVGELTQLQRTLLMSRTSSVA